MSPTLLAGLASRARRIFRRVLSQQQLNTETVVMHYDAAVLPPGFDRNDAATYPTPVPSTRQFSALVHFVSDTTRGFGPSVYEVGDVLLFLDPEQDTSGTGPFFVIHGREYVQKEEGGDLATEWSLEIGGTLIHRAMLLCLKRGQ